MTLPPHLDLALRQIGVVPAKVPPQPVRPMPTGTWYASPDDIPF